MAAQLHNIADFDIASIALSHHDDHHNAPAMVYEFPRLSGAEKSEHDGLGCARGTRLALGLEVAAGLFLYGAWFLWHLAR